MSSLTIRRLLLLGVAVGLSLFAGSRALASNDPMRALTLALERDRAVLAGRLSVLPGARPSRQAARPDGELTRQRLARLQASTKGGLAATLHRSALIDLAYSDSADLVAADRAVAELLQARTLRPADASLLADLSAAYLERARRTRSLADLPRAVQAARDALALEYVHPTARYNLAVALDEMMLDDQACAAWQAVARLEVDSATTVQARARAESLRAHLPTPPADSGSPAAWAAYAAREPQLARLYAMETLLSRWGDTAAAGRMAEAGPFLAAAESVGQTLLRRGGDRSLADQVDAIRALQEQPRHLRALARAHAHYGAAQKLLDERIAPAALARLDSAWAGASPPLRAWLGYWRGVALFYDERDASHLFQQALGEGNARGYPALAARAHWSLSVPLMREGTYGDAEAHLSRAEALYARIGEREHRGAVQELIAEMRFDMGDDAAGYRTARVALETLRPYRGSLRLHNLLMALGRAATLEGLPAAAAALHEEDLSVATRVRTTTRVEALVSRARARVQAGSVAAAGADLRLAADLLERDVARVRALAPGVGLTYEHRWLATDLREGYARLALRADPSAAADSLTPVIRFFERESGAVARLLSAVVLRAEARLAAGDQRGAEADLDRASRLLDSLSSKLRDATVRAAMLYAGRRVFDQLALLRAHDPAASLEALERGRVSFSAGRRARGRDVAIAAPDGFVLLSCALVGDALLTFTVRDTSVRLERQQIDTLSLLRRIESLRTRMELRQPADSLGDDLSRLYDVLIRPVADRLPAGVPLVIVADGELAAVPFDALLDTSRGRYLVKDHEIRFASSLADAHAPAAPADGGAPFFVADPAFRAADHPGVQRLGGLVEETRALAAAHPGAVVWSDTQATPGGVRSRLGSAGFFYFAGHAVFDDARPERSYLLLARDGQRGDRLLADTIAGMNLRRLRLVVLAACETQRSAGGRGSGFAGLSGAFLDAGAGGVIGSLWRVDDTSTRAVMAEFNRAYLASRDPAAALREAQLRLLESSDPSLSSPSAWAGFRYAGGASR